MAYFRIDGDIRTSVISACFQTEHFSVKRWGEWDINQFSS